MATPQPPEDRRIEAALAHLQATIAELTQQSPDVNEFLSRLAREASEVVPELDSPEDRQRVHREVTRMALRVGVPLSLVREFFGDVEL
ncbi:MAG TPA: hypothetical protein VEY50_00235 [Lysobacter sp.]|nr:hypothetical protein [Lysobacter sp.]